MSPREKAARLEVQRTHPDKGGTAEAFRAAKARLDALRREEQAIPHGDGDDEWVVIDTPFGQMRIPKSALHGRGVTVVVVRRYTYTSSTTNTNRWSSRP